MIKTTLKQKVFLICFGLLLVTVFLEIGLRIGGCVISFLQERRNRISIDKKGEYRIMCLGESTTVWGDENCWPSQLEEILNKKRSNVRFKVINKGRHAIETAAIVASLEGALNKYDPDMVITMIGVNDWVGTELYNDTFLVKTMLFIKGFRVYKLVRYIWSSVTNKVNELREGELQVKGSKDLDSNNNIQELFDFGYDYKNQSRHFEAKKAFERIIELDPDNENAYFELGLIYEELGDLTRAAEYLKKSLELDPNNSAAYVELGNCYREEGNRKGVRMAAKRALELNPNNKEVYFLIGRNYLEEGDYLQAEKMFQKALELDPKWEPAYTALGTCYRLQKDYSKLEELSNKIIREGINNDRLYGFVATCYRDQDRMRETEEYYNKANAFRMKYYNSATKYNYRKIKELVGQKGAKFVCMQYPMRSIEPLKRLFDSCEGIIFVDNENNFKDALRGGKYEDYFEDNFGGDFGHGTPKGNKLIAENVVAVILKEVFGR